MNIDVIQGRIQEMDTDAIVVNLFEDVREPGGATGAVDSALQGAVSEIIASGDFSGKIGEVAVLYPRGMTPAKRVLVVGLGKQEQFDLEKVRRASAAALKRAIELNARRVATIVHGAGVGGMNVADAAQATVEGGVLGLYQCRGVKKSQNHDHTVDELTLVEFDPQRLEEIRSGVKVAQAVTQAVYLARDLANLPPNVVTPRYMASTAREIANAYGMKVTVGDRAWAEERGMGGFLGVSQGAAEPAQFIVLEYQPENAKKDTLILVGKGITFDSGGVSLKPWEKMSDMKGDMSGAAAVLAAIKAAAMLELPLHIVGITPCTENMPDGGSYRPADVLTASNGKTIEVISTDAEGRLILADALVFAQQYHPAAVVDLATLTGACVIALGENISAALFCNDDHLRDQLLTSSQRTHERTWAMPLWDDYKKVLKSQVADLKNSGGRFSGVGSSAIFLKEFVDYPWAHVDMASMDRIEKDDGYIPEGATGYGVRLLVDFLRNWKSE